MRKSLWVFFTSILFLQSGFCNSSVGTLYNSLDPYSIRENFAFYNLYPDSPEGKRALLRAWSLLSKNCPEMRSDIKELDIPQFDIQPIVSLVTRQSSEAPPVLGETELQAIEILGQHFPNRRLKGHHVWQIEEVKNLPVEEVDLGRALLIYQFEKDPNPKEKIRQYEASLDLMALQIEARLIATPKPEEILYEMNRFIFHEMQFRFPPHSLYAQDIDLYTFLPSVMDSRQGVCLGVSILYLCLSQRLGLPLEIITPPGHIYLRYNDNGRIINIETTARGIDIPSEEYLGINTRFLKERNIKEVIGLAFINQASVSWAKEDYKTTVELYEKATPYLKEDPLLKMLLGINYLFIGKYSEGKKLLQEIRNQPFDDAVVPDSIPDDYLSGRVNVEGIKNVFLHIDETPQSIYKKQQQLRATLKKYPKFRAGLLQYAVTWMQLRRTKEALEVLEAYHKVDSNDPTIEYYLAVLSMERLNYPNSWNYLKKAEQIVSKCDHHPKALSHAKQSLRRVCPDPAL